MSPTRNSMHKLKSKHVLILYHISITQRMELFITMYVRTSNHTLCKLNFTNYCEVFLTQLFNVCKFSFWWLQKRCSTLLTCKHHKITHNWRKKNKIWVMAFSLFYDISQSSSMYRGNVSSSTIHPWPISPSKNISKKPDAEIAETK